MTLQQLHEEMKALVLKALQEDGIAVQTVDVSWHYEHQIGGKYRPVFMNLEVRTRGA